MHVNLICSYYLAYFAGSTNKNNLCKLLSIICSYFKLNYLFFNYMISCIFMKKSIKNNDYLKKSVVKKKKFRFVLCGTYYLLLHTTYYVILLKNDYFL